MLDFKIKSTSGSTIDDSKYETLSTLMCVLPSMYVNIVAKYNADLDNIPKAIFKKSLSRPIMSIGEYVKTYDNKYLIKDINDLKNVLSLHKTVHLYNNVKLDVSLLRGDDLFVHPIRNTLLDLILEYVVSKYMYVEHPESLLVKYDKLGISNHIALEEDLSMYENSIEYINEVLGVYIPEHPAINILKIEKFLIKFLIDNVTNNNSIKLNNIIGMVDSVIVFKQIMTPSSRRYNINLNLIEN